MFTRPKVAKPETQDETLYLQDRDETETFQKTSRDRDVQDRDYIPAEENENVHLAISCRL